MGQDQGVPAEFINAVFRRDTRIDLGFERYTLLSLLGSGGLGVVVKARKSTGELVALKFLYNQEAKLAAETFERFKQEIKATKMVGDISDACVRVYECGLHEQVEGYRSVPFFAMEYVPGLSLEDFILLKETPFTPREIYVIMRQIAAALEEIHDKGIVHRDIKPSNILFHESRRVLKVTDFGISRDTVARSDVTMPMPDGRPVILGTLNYLSRYYFDTVFIDEDDVTENENGEQVRRSTGERLCVSTDGRFYCAYKGRKLDLSVLASIILFELTTCVNPYAGATFPAILTDILSGYKIDLRGFYRENPARFHPGFRQHPTFLAAVEGIIRKGSTPVRAYSYNNARELVDDLDRAGTSVWERLPGEAQMREIMGILLGKTLVDEYERVLHRIERAVRNDTIAADRSNAARLALLFKLKRCDRLMACIDLLHAKTAGIIRDSDGRRKDAYFYLGLWERLERFGIEVPYRHNTRRLKDSLDSRRKVST